MFFIKYKFSIATFICFVVFSFLLRASQDDNVTYNLIFAILNAITLCGCIGLITCLKKYRVLSVLFILLLSFVVTVDMTHYFVYGAILSVGGIASVFETNQKESFDMLKVLLPIAIPILLLMFALVFLSVREFSSIRKVGLKSTVSVFVSLLIVFCLFYSMIKGNRGRFIEDLKSSPLLATQVHIGLRIPLVANTNFCLISYFSEMAKFRAEIAKPKSMPDGISKNDDKTPNTVFVVIGESSIQTHYSLYGYDLPTTPFLDSLSQINKLYHYNAVAPAPITREALCLSLTFASPLNKQPLTENKNIITLANEAGYTSYWISNQDKVGMYDSYIGLIASYTNQSVFYNYQRDDLFLANVVDSLYNPAKKQLFFIHLKGSHISYDDKFDAIDTEKLPIPESRKETANYDKSIHHTDRVLASLYNRMFVRDTLSSKLLYYYSDHGEIVNVGHGLRNSNMNQFVIPFVVIPQYVTHNTDSLILKYTNNNILNTTNFSYIFAESIGYTTSKSKVEEARNSGLYYLHVDGQVYPFEQKK